MRTIPLSRGLEAIVDDADHEWLSQWKWTADLAPNGKFYAHRMVKQDSGRRKVRMHQLLCARGPNGVDHKNGDSLDNRRENLRPCSKSQNACNRGVQRNSTSGFKGVSRRKDNGLWAAYIKHCGKRRHLGLHETKVGAAIAYNIAAIQLHGEFAVLNDVFSGEVAP